MALNLPNLLAALTAAGVTARKMEADLRLAAQKIDLLPEQRDELLRAADEWKLIAEGSATVKILGTLAEEAREAAVTFKAVIHHMPHDTF